MTEIADLLVVLPDAFGGDPDHHQARKTQERNMDHRKLVVTAQNRPIDVARRGPLVVVNYAEHVVTDAKHGMFRERMLAEISTYIDKLIAGEVDDIVIERSEGWDDPDR